MFTCSAEHMLFMGSADYPDENEVCLYKLLYYKKFYSFERMDKKLDAL